MTFPDRRLALTRCEPEHNVARFYEISIEPTLFGDHTVVRQWGRIGSRGRVRIDLHATHAEAVRAFQRLAAAKRKRHYR